MITNELKVLHILVALSILISCRTVREDNVEIRDDIVLSVPSPYDNPQAWECDYIEEFNGAFSNSWVIRDDKGRHREWFKPENVTMDANYLYLRATDEALYGKTVAGSEIFTGIGHGDYDGNFKYGFYEIKCKFPSDGGFTSFWLGPKNGKYNYKEYPPEIDIFEIEKGSTYLTGTIWGINDADDMGHKVRPVSSNIDTAFSSNFFSNWHTVGLVWTPSKITFYLDGIETGSSNYEVQEELKMIISYQLGGHDIIFNNGIADPFIIDYVKRCVPRNSNYDAPKRWGYCWHNGRKGSGRDNPDYRNFDGQWKTKTNSKFYRFDHDGNGVDELLATDLNGGEGSKIKLMYLDNSVESWKDTWTNEYEQNDGKLGVDWYLGKEDRILVGNFDNTSPSEEIILISAKKYAGMYNYLSTFIKKWGNGGPDINGYGMIGDWNIASDDQFIVGDFTGNGTDELLCVSKSKYAKLIKFSNGFWSTIWGNGGSGWIGDWKINFNDNFMSGHFTLNNITELCCISNTKYAKMLKFSNGNWTTVWGNGGSDWIGSWKIGENDKYIIGDFDDDGFDEITAYSNSTDYSKILKFQSGNISTLWGNAGDGRIYDWKIRKTDKYIVGNFINDGICTANAQVLAVRSENGFVDQSAVNHKDFRAALWFSPVSHFWSTHYVK